MSEQEHIGSVAVGDSTPEWRYEIKHGPDGEANYAWLYRGDEMIATMRTHHAVAIAAALARPAQETVAPFMYGIMQPDGSAYFEDYCVDRDEQDLQGVIDDQELEGHKVTPLYAAIDRTAQGPVAYRAADPDGDGYIYLDRDKTVDVYRKAGVQFTPLYAAPQPVINPTHSQVAGTPGLLTETAPVAEIIAKLREDMTASPVDGVTVIDRGQLAVLSAALTPSPQDHMRVSSLSFQPYPGDGSTIYEGQNEQRRYVARALLPWSGAVFVMEKDGVFTLTGSCDGFFHDEQSAKDAAQAEFAKWILASVEPTSPALNVETFTRQQMLAEVDRRVERALLARDAVSPSESSNDE